MAVSIRLARQGSKKRPFYRIVATNRRSPRDGRFIEMLGHYDPKKKDFRIDKDRYENWVSHGALASATVTTLVKRYGNVIPEAAPAPTPVKPGRSKPGAPKAKQASA